MDLVKSGVTMVIHCHGGSGRTGMMAAILMLDLGYAPAQVKKKKMD
nr:tyrosine-protein phosphatase [Brenneria ulupoensis]